MPRKEHPLEEKLIVVKRYLSGESATSLEHEYGIDHHDVVMYVNRYVRYGEDGLRPRVSKVTPVEVKMQAVMEYLEHCVSLPELANKYDVDRSTIRIWAHTFEKQGMGALRDRRNDKRPQQHMYTGNDKAASETIKELRERVKDLEAENALLKKVKALVEKREAQLRETGSKPSKN